MLNGDVPGVDGDKPRDRWRIATTQAGGVLAVVVAVVVVVVVVGVVVVVVVVVVVMVVVVVVVVDSHPSMQDAAKFRVLGQQMPSAEPTGPPD